MASAMKLRRLKRKDWRDMFEYGQDEETTKFLRWGPYKTEQEAKESNYMLRKNADQVFAIDVYGKMIGTATLMNIKEDSVEVGYVLNKEYWGMGIGTMALTQLMNFAYRWHKGKNIYAEVHVDNEASQKLLLKCGFEKTKKNIKDHFIFEFKA